ncbi:hypothetical protein BDZ91DRAFT_800593 [Kalaharituber pfeilii]|nr:hypothetical protein BDZ91DRAFT_800593 [Kalaharituber pfeilii]
MSRSQSSVLATPPPPVTRKRKGKTPFPGVPYAIKRQLNNEEAQKIASTPSVDSSAGPTPATTTGTPAGDTPATTKTTTSKPSNSRRTPQAKMPPAPSTSSPRPQTTPPRPKASPHTSTKPDNTTKRQGIVVHGIALRKELGNVKRWLKASNQDMGKILEIRWLRKKATLVEEGKKTSSAVVYLETQTEIGRIRLGGRWLRASV